VRAQSLSANRELELELSQSKLPGINERPCLDNDVVGSWRDRRCLVCPVPKNLPPELAFSRDEIRRCLVRPILVNISYAQSAQQITALADPRGLVIQGDIRIHPNQTVTAGRGTGRTSVASRWPGGVVPFTIDGSIVDDPTDNDDVWDRVQWAINQWQTNMPVRFLGVTPAKDKPCGIQFDDCVTFQIGKGCDSPIGRVGGQQFINLTTGCGKGSVAHEIGHTIGLFHEHSAELRDKFVRILDVNIVDELKHNFDKFSAQWTDGLDYSSYDYESIMHYGQFAFSKNGNATIMRLDGGPAEAMGQRNGLSDRGPSDRDRAAVEAMYGSFAFSYRGDLPGRKCIKVTEPQDPDGWGDNYFCANKEGAVWSDNGKRPNLACTQITESSDSHFWDNNFLCVPFAWRERFTWSTNGPKVGKRCIAFNEPSDPDGWSDNFLCWDDAPPMDPKFKSVQIKFSDIDDDAYAWVGDTPGENRNAICSARIVGIEKGRKECDLTQLVQSIGLGFDQQFIVKFGNGGGFDSEGKFDIVADGKTVFSRSKGRAVRHTGWFYRIVLAIDFIRGTVRVFDEKPCNDVFECRN
jgi:hypothetical protein